jgi:hypothetical protein
MEAEIVTDPLVRGVIEQSSTMGQQNEISRTPQKFSMYPIERIARGVRQGGADDEHFDPSILPFEVIDHLNVEDVSRFIAEDEFSLYRDALGMYSHGRFEKIKYVLVHRYPEYEIDPATGTLKSGREQSRTLVGNAMACLRLLRPAMQHLQFFEGEVNEDGQFCRIAFRTPLDSVMNPVSHRTLSFRTADAKNLRLYLPLFLEAMNGQYWKFRMAAQLHESGCFQDNDLRAKFFLWTTAVESLFTTQSDRGNNSGSLVATERIKFFLGSKTSIYPPDELASVYVDPHLCIEDVVKELYCLRNHIAHGDRIPEYYFEQGGRQDILKGEISRFDMLLEAVSFIIRHSLLKILKENLLGTFANASHSDIYFKAHGLTKSGLDKMRLSQVPCPD